MSLRDWLPAYQPGGGHFTTPIPPLVPLPVFHAPRSSYEEKNKSDQDCDPQAMMLPSQADSP